MVGRSDRELESAAVHPGGLNDACWLSWLSARCYAREGTRRVTLRKMRLQLPRFPSRFPSVVPGGPWRHARLGCVLCPISMSCPEKRERNSKDEPCRPLSLLRPPPTHVSAFLSSSSPCPAPPKLSASAWGHFFRVALTHTHESAALVQPHPPVPQLS